MTWRGEKMKFEVQTRDDDGALKFFDTLAEAFQYAAQHDDVWKVSFSLPTEERVRLVRDGNAWRYENLLDKALEATLGSCPFCDEQPTVVEGAVIHACPIRGVIFVDTKEGWDAFCADPNGDL